MFNTVIIGDIDLSVYQKFIISNMRRIALDPGGCVARSLISGTVGHERAAFENAD